MTDVTVLANHADELIELLTRSASASMQRADALDIAAWNAANPAHLKGPDGKWADVPGGSPALDKLKLGKLAPDGFTVQSSNKLKTDYADVGIAEMNTPDGPQVRVGILTSESGKWDAGFTGEDRKAQLRRQIAEKQALFDSGDEQPGDIEDELHELKAQLEELDSERNAVLSPKDMAEFHRQLGDALQVAKANKSKQDETMRAVDAIEGQIDDLAADHSNPDLERRIRKAQGHLGSMKYRLRLLREDPHYAQYIPEAEANVAEAERALEPLLAQRAALMPSDARVRLEGLENQKSALIEGDIDGVLASVQVPAADGLRLVAEVSGNDDVDSDWVTSRLYVLRPGETTDDVDNLSGDLGHFSGLKGLNKLIAGFHTPAADSPGTSTRAAARRGGLRRAGGLDVAKWNAEHPDHLKGPDGKWADGPSSGTTKVLADKLKLAGRIPLGDGETLAGSDIFEDADGTLVPMALTEGPDGKRLRIGTGILDEHRKSWAGRDLGSTANLDGDGIRQLRATLDQMAAVGQDVDRRMLDLEGQQDKLDARKRDVLRRQFPALTADQARQIDAIDEKLDDLGFRLRFEEQQRQANIDELPPAERARWDAIEVEIAQLSRTRSEAIQRWWDSDRQDALAMVEYKQAQSDIEDLLDEQARLHNAREIADFGESIGNYGRWFQELDDRVDRRQREIEAAQMDRDEITGDPVPLADSDRAELAAIAAERARVDAAHQKLEEVTVLEGVVPGQWADLLYEVTTAEASSIYDDGAVRYSITARPHDTPDDWDSTAAGSALVLADLAKLGKMLDNLAGPTGTRLGGAGFTRAATPTVTHAGLAVLAADTGRMLMLQRALDDEDPASGMWEWPGGGIEDGETPLDAAKREWSEETGCELPVGEVTGEWRHGVYSGFVWRVPAESAVEVFGDRDEVTNPDDPDQDQTEALAWWEPSQLTATNPALREELRQSVATVLAAIGGAKPSPAGMQRAAGVPDAHGNLHAEDGKFMPKTGIARTGVLGGVLDKLEALRERLGNDDRSILDQAMDQLRGLESSDVDDDDLIDDEDDAVEVEEDDGLLGLVRRYNPRQPRVSGGENGGQWVSEGNVVGGHAKAIADFFRSPTYNKISTRGHIALDLIGLAPGFGEPFDLANAAWYLAERQPKNALLSLGSSVPGLGYGTAVFKILKHIRTARALIDVRRTAKAAKAVAETATRSVRQALGVPLDGGHDKQLVAQMRKRWGTDPRPWAVLHAHITRRAGVRRADRVTGTLFAAANADSDQVTARSPARDAAIAWHLRKYDPDQARDPDGKWSKIGAIKNALSAFVGDDAKHIDGGYGVATFPDRDGVAGKRDVEWEIDGDDYTMSFRSDEFGLDEDAARPTVGLDSQAFRSLADQIALLLLADEKPPFDPDDRASMLLHSVLAVTLGAAHANDDGTYIDISRMTSGAYALEFDDGESDAKSMEISKDELARLHASMLLTLMAQRPWLRSTQPTPRSTAAVLAASIVDHLVGHAYTREQNHARAVWLASAAATQPVPANARAAVLAASIVDELTGGRYTTLQWQARAAWLAQATNTHTAGTVIDKLARSYLAEFERAGRYNIRWPRGAKLGGKGVGGRWMDLDGVFDAWVGGGEDPFEQFDEPRLAAIADALDLNPPTTASKTQLKDLLHAKAVQHVKENGATPATKAAVKAVGAPRVAKVGTAKGRDLLSGNELDIANLAATVRIGDAKRGAGGYDDRGPDEALAAIARQQGFDRLPKVVSKQQLDKRIAAGDVELFRRVGSTAKRGAELAEQFRSGPAYYGRGEWANGIHATANADRVAKYGTPEGALRMALRADARTATIEQLREIRRDRQEHTNWPQDDIVLFRDLGRLAAALGYDAIEPDDDPRSPWIILNRNAVTVQAADTPAASKPRVPTKKATSAPARPPKSSGDKSTVKQAAETGRDMTGDRQLAIDAFDASNAHGQWATDKPANLGSHNHRRGHLAFITVADRQGFNDLPKVITDGDKWKQLKDSGKYVALFRGHPTVADGRTGGDLTREFMYGDRYAGAGFGTGTNMSPNVNGAAFYSDSSTDSVGAYLLPHNAKVAEFEQVLADQRAFLASIDGRDSEKLRAVYGDLGTFAAARGYDAMRVPEGTGGGVTGKQDEWVIFNRAKLLAYDHRGKGKERLDKTQASAVNGSLATLDEPKPKPKTPPAPRKKAEPRAPARKQAVPNASPQALTGHAALAVPPRNLEALTAANDPRADALWYRAGDNSKETESGRPGSFEMSAQMRGQEKLTPKMKERVKAIDSVMAESQLPEPILVYRGADRIGGIRPDEAIGEGRNLVGREFTDKAFVPTTADAAHASWFGGTVLRIKVPAGVSAIRMADRKGTERDQLEAEILLDRLLKFRVVAQYGRGELKGDWGGAYVLDAEVVP